MLWISTLFFPLNYGLILNMAILAAGASGGARAEGNFRQCTNDALPALHHAREERHCELQTHIS